jgi:hypothetical protein
MAPGYNLQEPPPGFDTWEDWARTNGIPEDQWDAMSAIGDPQDRGARILFQRVLEPKSVKTSSTWTSTSAEGGRSRWRNAGRGSTPRRSG